jgi:hypothetical protein
MVYREHGNCSVYSDFTRMGVAEEMQIAHAAIYKLKYKCYSNSTTASQVNKQDYKLHCTLYFIQPDLLFTRPQSLPISFLVFAY